ncbi:MAG: hypothetical protein QOD86_938 [Miltoncostaeaceae bacterium]|nr:hypothetical protein [Miltoncostaeaceae bacterium]
MRGPVIGVWSAADADRFGEALHARVLERELTRRLPGATVRAFAPFGALHPTRFDGGRPAEPLGAWSEERVAELDGVLDLVVIAGGALARVDDRAIATAYEADREEIARIQPSAFVVEALGAGAATPVAWLGVEIDDDLSDDEAARLRAALAARALVAVADEASRDRLRAAGVEREIEVLPSLLLLAARVPDPGALRRRLDGLRAVGAYPASGRPRRVAVGPGGEGRAAEVARTATAVAGDLDQVVPVVAATGRGGGEVPFAQAVLTHMPRGTAAILDAATTDDLLAAIGAASALVSGSPAATLVARAYGVPVVDLDATPREALEDAIRSALDAADPPASDALADAERLDAALDRLAEVARSAAAGRDDGAPAAPEATGALAAQAHLERLERLMGDLARERERAAALARDLAEERKMTAHLQGAYEATVAQNGALGQAVDGLKSRIRDAEVQLGASQLNHYRTLEGMHEQMGSLHAQIGSLDAERGALLARVADLEAQVELLRGESAQKEAVIQSVITSKSWRALAPARSAGQAIRRRVG